MKRHGNFLFGLALTAAGCALAATPATAQMLPTKTTGVKGLLANASDGALDKLAQPNAFYADEAVRILLPGPLKKATSIMRLASKAGLTKDFSKSLNDAAGLAAAEAKPVFRSAIDRMTLTDGIGIVTGGGTGATDYLRKTSGEELAVKVRPLVEAALGKVGAYDQLGKLNSLTGGGKLAGLSRLGGLDLSNDGLTKSVTEQALNGIFTYIGREEKNFRANPLDKAGKILDQVF